MAYISISIDMCNSTLVKQQIQNHCGRDTPASLKLYEEFVRQCATYEVDFYGSMLDEGLEFERMHVVKTIGDEVWLLYDIDAIETGTERFNAIVHGLLRTCETVSSRSQSVRIDISGEDKIKVIPKIFLDLIINYSDLSRVRTESIEDLMGEIYGRISMLGMDEIEASKKEMFQRFGLNERGADSVKRIDPVGIEVDLFFRCVRSAVPGIACVGQRLLGNMLEVPVDTLKTQILARDRISLKMPDSTITHYIHRSRLLEKIKGLEGSYSIHYLHSERRFGKNLEYWMGDQQAYRETLELIAGSLS